MAHFALAGLLALALFQGSASDTIVRSSEHVEITEWTVPWPDTRPRDPAVGSADEIWFVGQQGDYVGLLRPSTGEFERFDLPDGAGPHNVIVGSDGAPWYSGNTQSHIGRVDPETGEVTEFMMPEPDQVRDPHTLLLDEGSGDIWFTAQFSNYVGRLSPSRDGEVGLIEVPTERARPYGIVMDSMNRPWFVEFGTNKIARIDPENMMLTEYPLPNDDARPRRIGLTSDDGIWYVDYARGSLGRMDPVTHEVSEWRTPGGPGSQPYAMTVDDMDRLWFVETNPRPNRLVGFDPETEAFFSVTDVGSGGGAVRHMVFDPETRQIWFGTDANTVGRAQLK